MTQPAHQQLLDWYDTNAREMPWRVPPALRKAGHRPDAYGVWMSEVMLQQTTVAAVRGYFTKFMALWPTVHALAAAPDADVMAAWAGLGYYARARNLLKCARVVAHDHGGVFPSTQAGLQKLPGIGPYTSAAIAAIAFDQAAVVVDGNVERVMARLFDDHTPLPAAKAPLTAYAASLTPSHRPGDYAQAVMDLGATICTPKSPNCGLCPWQGRCLARQRGTAAQLPKKTPKAAKPTRYGHVFVMHTQQGDILLETRPARGLLGGMLGFPGSDWATDHPAYAPPTAADWQVSPMQVRHTFTHFHLILTVHCACVPQVPAGLSPVAAHDFTPQTLPTVMRKVWTAAQIILGSDHGTE